MSDIVLIKPIGSHMEPYTTAAVIAEYAEVQRYTVDRLIRKHEKDLELFGKVGFEITPLTGSKTGQRIKTYHLNEQQATLVITYLKNTPHVRKFKKQLVRDFFAMREELTKRRVLRELGKPTQRTLTDAIRDSGEGERMKGHAYNTYINLAYKAALGKNAGQLRKERGADKKAHAVDFLTSDELQAVERIKQGIIILLDAHLSYDAIRFALLGEVHP